jgi:hypothetical protein
LCLPKNSIVDLLIKRILLFIFKIIFYLYFLYYINCNCKYNNKNHIRIYIVIHKQSVCPHFLADFFNNLLDGYCCFF